MKTITVYVAGYEGGGGLTSAAFEWRYKKEDATAMLAEYEKYVKDQKDAVAYGGKVKVIITAKRPTHSEKERDSITEQVENFLMENDWENAFKEK